MFGCVKGWELPHAWSMEYFERVMNLAMLFGLKKRNLRVFILWRVWATHGASSCWSCSEIFVKLLSMISAPQFQVWSRCLMRAVVLSAYCEGWSFSPDSSVVRLRFLHFPLLFSEGKVLMALGREQEGVNAFPLDALAEQTRLFKHALNCRWHFSTQTSNLLWRFKDEAET